MKIQDIQVDILCPDKPQKQYSHNGKIFTEAKIGKPYKIRIKNNSANKVLTIVSSDGINVIDGSPASQTGTGYIIQGFSSYEIAGFRTSNDKVNLFEFCAKQDSYANKNLEINSTQSCGVIGVAIFEEKRPVQAPFNLSDWMQGYRPIPWRPRYPDFPTYDYPYDITCSSDSVGSLQSELRQERSVLSSVFDAGTAFSKHEIEDKVKSVEFEKGEFLGVTEIFYATREGLKALGVDVDKETGISFPDSFPGQKFCKPPTK